MTNAKPITKLQQRKLEQLTEAADQTRQWFDDRNAAFVEARRAGISGNRIAALSNCTLSNVRRIVDPLVPEARSGGKGIDPAPAKTQETKLAAVADAANQYGIWLDARNDAIVAAITDGIAQSAVAKAAGMSIAGVRNVYARLGDNTAAPKQPKRKGTKAKTKATAA